MILFQFFSFEFVLHEFTRQMKKRKKTFKTHLSDWLTDWHADGCTDRQLDRQKTDWTEWWTNGQSERQGKIDNQTKCQRDGLMDIWKQGQIGRQTIRQTDLCYILMILRIIYMIKIQVINLSSIWLHLIPVTERSINQIIH